MEIISKRLLVSGLTPQITQEDLSRRLSTFGKVTSLDGIGKLDALGRPRPFAFATLETTKGQLAKCSNLLSGSTWKGAKLRIGEAKPDFTERVRKEREEVETSDLLHPKKKRRRIMRGCIGIHAADMTPVSPANVAQRSGWRTTPLGRLLRPMRMRPLRPLTLSSSSLANSTSTRRPSKKQRQKPPPTRTRRRLLDPEFWGAEYLKGVMLEGTTNIVTEEAPKRAPGSSKNDKDIEPPSKIGKQRSPSPAFHAIAPKEISRSKKITQSALGASDLAQEATQNLSLLKSLFSDDANDWGGAESLSDMDIPAEETVQIPVGNSDRFDSNIGKDGKSKSDGFAEGMSSEVEVSATVAIEDENKESPPSIQNHPTVDSPSPPKQVVQKTKLKDMFAPRAEEASFSLLGNLDLDLELDEIPEAVAPTLTQTETVSPFHSYNISLPERGVAHTRASLFSIDPSKPLFFPPSLLPESNLPFKPTSDILSLMNNSSNSFCRTEDEDTIRARWDERKVELTRDWKRRHREAVKSARRRGGLQD